MTKPAPLEIYKLLPQTNCGKCVMPSCLAFAAAVAAGRKRPADCPDISAASLAALAGKAPGPRPEPTPARFIERLREKTAALDFAAVAPVIGADTDRGRLRINSLGKDFFVDQEGNLYSECHIISWVQVPILSYITNPTHEEVSGEWVSFREIEGGIDWQGLFASRCEAPLKRLADANPGLLADLIDIFNGREVDWYEADIALVLHPLPHLPVMICYQAPEDGIDSLLTIFFDRCCGVNLPIKPLFTLCSGLVQMFAKVAEHHM